MEENRLSENSENIFFWMQKNWNQPNIFSKKDDPSLFSSVDLSHLLGMSSLCLLDLEK